MMRYGLVESSLALGGLLYRATCKGAELIADGRPLPFFPVVQARRVRFLIEGATLRSFLSREVPLIPATWLDELQRRGDDVRQIPLKRRGREGFVSEEQLERLCGLAARARDEVVTNGYVVHDLPRESGFMMVAADAVGQLPRDAGEALRKLLSDAAAPTPSPRAPSVKRA